MLFLRGARQLLTLRGSPRRGGAQPDLGLIRDGGLLIDGGKILEVGATPRLVNLARARGARVIDVSGKVVLPGFIDCHTHLSYDQPHLEEFERRVAGAPTAPHTVRRTSATSLTMTDLKNRSSRWLRMALAHGVTTSDVRSRVSSGHKALFKSLRAVKSLSGHPQELRSTVTFETAGLSPQETLALFDALLGRGRAAYACEVDCTPSRADLAQAVETLDIARRYGFALKVQADRFERQGAARMAVEMGALTVEHAIHLSETDIDALAAAPTIAVLMPGAAFHHDSGDFPPARRLVDSGAAVALATGFGPDECPTPAMSVVLSLACRQLRLMPEEAIAAATINAAAAIGCDDRLGSLEPGKQADIAVFDVSDYREIPYYLGLNLCVMTLKKGVPVYPRRPPTPVGVAADQHVGRTAR